MKQQKPAKFQRVLAGIVLAAAFVGMASVFTPERSKAGDFSPKPRSGAQPTQEYFSTNPHEGLRSLGSLEAHGYRVTMYSTAHGTRYSVHEVSTGRELGTLLTAEQIDQWFPELQLPSLDFSADDNTLLMLAEPRAFE